MELPSKISDVTPEWIREHFDFDKERKTFYLFIARYEIDISESPVTGIELTELLAEIEEFKKEFERDFPLNHNYVVSINSYPIEDDENVLVINMSTPEKENDASVLHRLTLRVIDEIREKNAKEMKKKRAKEKKIQREIAERKEYLRLKEKYENK